MSPHVASASLLDGCPDADASQPFLPWGDQAMYVPAPDGGFEYGGGAWDLQDGATVVAGNETFQVGGAGDSQALALPDGSDATTPPICIGLDSPTLRLFVRNGGDPDSSLRVSVIVDAPRTTDAADRQRQRDRFVAPDAVAPHAQT